MIYSTSVPASKVKAIQELIGDFGLYFDTNPYPLRSNNPEGNWRVSINYSNCSSEKKKSFDDAFDRLIKPIKETHRKFSLVKKLKINTVNRIKLLIN